ncbi:ornithine-acyl[acyl carrier protein] N-acyltransferase [Micromonospora sediminicola]|uniref:Ornithine-acyl[acyl carrier protein] N-acyltransferase n=1 Tax=Micromonospora sediminicola TaxID=946078 RepID=A0A1A9B6F8_9ACTN|nr:MULTISPECIES: GNAT family N-acyltransferase [Micromonospora]PGH42585.1 GNAT family N-acetyltransferase [Micromonospora sp. WMMA1996]SBT64604.1 ornithine-acyl[acyl carrier protein] N-acyltransferase [Micromonospora sediminicola]
MAVLHAAGAPLTTSGYTLLIADDPTLVAAAQRLRHEVFAGELGATLPPGSAGLDADEFDAHCDHLVVLREGTGEVVGTYRLLPPGRTDRRYADGEFDLAPLAPLRDDLVEAGRSCVHPDHRTGAVINLMWAGICRYLHLRGSRWLGGCASVPVADGGTAAAEVWARVRARHLAPPPLRVTPRRPWLAEAPAAVDPATLTPAERRALVPPLLRGYLRLGAWVGGEPAYDPDFGCADFYVLFSLDRMNPRYLKHFLGEVGS